MSIPISTTLKSRCTQCRERTSGLDAAVYSWARTHEGDTGHRVIVMDGPTSYMPREFWAAPAATETTTPAAPAIGRIYTQSPASEVAVPIDSTIVLDGDTHATADCANCPSEVGVTIAPDGEVFTWYHRATGRERCDATLTPLTFP